jgi:type II restriction/modification system DNA methylase subunit YeeA
LQPLNQIERKDAILDMTKPARPVEPTWPKVDVIVGNPPFLGGKLLRGRLRNPYVDSLFAVWEDRVPREADLCAYWFEKARAAIEAGSAVRAGLLATQGIRGGANRKVLERIKETGDIFYAQADREWILDGATVHVSMVGFDDGTDERRLLNDDSHDVAKHALLRARPVASINANLTSGVIDVTKAQRLKENVGISFIGLSMHGPFELDASDAKAMLSAPTNVNGKPNTDVVLEIRNAESVTGRKEKRHVVFFSPAMTEEESAKYEQPFEYARRVVGPVRAANHRKLYRERWWQFGEPRPSMLMALGDRLRYLVTPRVSKHRVFAWLSEAELPSDAVVAFARSDDFAFGVLQSRPHEVWARSTGTQLREQESGFRYTPTTSFETFPFPTATQKQQWAISIAAKDLDELRETWLNPKEMIGAKELRKRTLTNLYNQRPTWLINAHRMLDEAVFAAYGWPEPPDKLSDSEIITRLLALNLSREPA